MALTVEDGTGVEGATSYVSLDEARAYATARGLSLPAVDDAGDAALEVLLVRGFDYLEAQRARYQGAKVHGTGFPQWPRSDVVIDDEEFPVDAIPAELKNAQCQLAVELQTVDPYGTTTSPAIRQKTIGPLTTIYAVADGQGAPVPKIPKVDALLAPLFRSAGRFVTERA